jgi:hypothetical protein
MAARSITAAGGRMIPAVRSAAMTAATIGCPRSPSGLRRNLSIIGTKSAATGARSSG